MYDSFWPHGLQHTRLPCPSLSPGICSNSCPLSCLWCHPAISSSVVPFSSCPQSFLASGSFPMMSVCIRWPKYWSFSFSTSTSNKIQSCSFRIDWFDLLAAQEILESSLAPQFESINSLTLSLAYGPTLTSIHDYWKKHGFEYMDLC